MISNQKMGNKMMNKIGLMGILLLLTTTLSAQNVCDFDIQINRRYEKKIGPLYKKAMRAYSKRHYGMDTEYLVKPRIIVIHATHVATLKETLNYFRGPYLSQRKDLTWGGNVNVGTQFLVDRDGTIYSFVPEQYMARHAVGINYTSIGIENIAYRNNYLTRAQIRSNVRLIGYLRNKYPSVRYVIGHHEYNKKNMPHTHLIVTKDKRYKPWDKNDPGAYFMRQLRAMLRKCDQKNK